MLTPSLKKLPELYLHQLTKAIADPQAMAAPPRSNCGKIPHWRRKSITWEGLADLRAESRAQ
jgi:hypothetical protein